MRRPSNVVSSKLAAWLIPAPEKIASRHAKAVQIRGPNPDFDVLHGNLMRQKSEKSG
jgi:hypothetical protein